MDDREADVARPPRVKSRANLASLEAPEEILLAKEHHTTANSNKKYNCLCAPTNHPGSFRCRLHRNAASSSGGMRRGFSVGSNLSDLSAKNRQQASLQSLFKEV